MVLSYTTSPAYHIVAEGTERYKAAPFSEGHYLQVEVAGMTRTGAAQSAGRRSFCHSWSAPASRTSFLRPTGCCLPARPTKPLNPAFDTLVKPEKTLIYSSEEVAKNRKAWVDEWLGAMSE